jgi:hypothetical protein
MEPPFYIFSKTFADTQIGVSSITLKEIQNSEYYSITLEKKVKLKNGRYFRRYSGMVSGELLEIYKDRAAYGDLNNDEKVDTAVIIASTTGGTGYWLEIAVMINKKGLLSYLTGIVLGDRVRVNSITIQSGEIILDMLVHGPNDGLCCPSIKKISKYQLSHSHLIEIP